MCVHYACQRTRECIRTFLCMDGCVCSYVRTYASIHSYVCMYLYLYVCMYVCMYVKSKIRVGVDEVKLYLKLKTT